jgi:hypothetical protein
LRFEDKFGIKPKLSDNQIVAQSILSSKFHMNSFVPADIGKITGFPAGLVAPQIDQSGDF